MRKAPESARKIRGGMYSDKTYGNNGVFIFPHYKVIDYEIRCIISDGEGWEHVSVTVSHKDKDPSRSPTWEEMCYVKQMFWHDEECVIQYHPAKTEYVNCHPFCLHLWKPVNKEIPIPNKLMVGL